MIISRQATFPLILIYLETKNECLMNVNGWINKLNAHIRIPDKGRIEKTNNTLNIRNNFPIKITYWSSATLQSAAKTSIHNILFITHYIYLRLLFKTAYSMYF